MPASNSPATEKYLKQEGLIYLSGNQAYLRIVFEQNRRDKLAGLTTGGFISGYRGSPFGQFDQDVKRVNKELAERHIHFSPGVNEAMAANAVWGSQQLDFFGSSSFDGVIGLWYGKGPGVDHAGDALRHSNLWGTHPNGGVVMAVGDDPMSRSSSIQQQSEFALSGACIPVFHASSVQDIYDFGLIAYQLSRFAGVWVAVKSVSDIAESWFMVDVDPKRTETVIPDNFEMPECGAHIRWPDVSVAQDERMMKARLPAVRAFAKANKLNKVTLDCEKRRVGIVSAGKSYLDTKEALDDLDIGDTERNQIGLAIFKVALIWPLEETSIQEFAQTVDEILVIEEGRTFLETQVKDALYNLPGDQRPKVFGKRRLDGSEQFPSNGELTPVLIARALSEWFEPHFSSEAMSNWVSVLDNSARQLSVARTSVERAPYFCSGCPHNTSTKQPDDSIQLIGIGCHYLARFMDRGGVSFPQMGGEGATWAGAAPFVDAKHVFANLGDGTYYHSGSNAIRQSVAAGTNITYKILFNDAVAMTGGQAHDGPLTVPAITHQVKAEGAKKVVVVSSNPDQWSTSLFASGTELYHRDDYQRVLKDLEQIPGCTVVVYEQMCATELRRRRKRGLAEDPKKRTYINYRICEGCGDCGVASNCLSVQPLETELGRKRMIDQSACNKDFSCVKGFCPSFVTIEGGDLAKGKGVDTNEDIFANLPMPAVAEIDGVYGALVCGIGGTGVVTISSLLGEAAQAEGKAAQVLDLTGMAQKFGAVYCHLKIGHKVEDLKSTRLSTGKADVLIGADIVTSASDEGLARLREGHTHAIVNNHETVTGAFTRDINFHIPVNDMEQAINRFTGGRADFFDSTDISTRVTGDSIGANIMLLGYACQKGLLPVTYDSLIDAIRKNGVAVDYNIRAFDLGRLLAHSPAKVSELMEQGFPTPDWQVISENVEQMIDRRHRDLVAYQNTNYANKYRDFVTKVRETEKALVDEKDFNNVGNNKTLTEAVARYLYKVMAYKDEYEVARFYTDGRWLANINRQFAGDFKLKFHLAPPLISKRDPETGHLQKREFGQWMYPLLKLTAKFKFLRGTRFDPCGFTAERRAERELITRYMDTIEEMLPRLNAQNHDMAIQAACTPEEIKGYGHVKERNLEKANQLWVERMDLFHNPEKALDVVKIVQPA